MAAGAGAVGFVLAPSRRQISLVRARQLARRAGQAQTVAVLVDPTREEIEAALEFADLVQLHGDESPSLCQLYAGRVLKAFRVTTAELAPLEQYRGLVAGILLDGSRPGSGQSFDWSLLHDWNSPAPLWLAGGLHPGNVAGAIARLRPYAVDVSSGVEKSPGRKDPELVRAFCQAVLSA